MLPCASVNAGTFAGIYKGAILVIDQMELLPLADQEAPAYQHL